MATGQEGITLCMNQVGYRPGETGRLTVMLPEAAAGAESAGAFRVLTENGTVIAQGALSAPRFDAACGQLCAGAEFTANLPVGAGGAEAAGKNAAAGGSDMGDAKTDAAGRSAAVAGACRAEVTTPFGRAECRFEIRDDVYEELFGELFRMLYRQRCGVEIPEGAGGAFAHGACHLQRARVYGEDRSADVHGGWHDAGDYGRYVVPGAKTVMDLFLALAWAPARGDGFGIPESGSGVPDLLSEARWELEWMLRMQDEQTGGVWHKVTGASFPGFVMPEEETWEMILSPVSTAATADFAAVMARAATVYRTYDADFAGQCREAARRAWRYLGEAGEAAAFRNPEGIVTGEYGDAELSDELLWAAAELYLSGETQLEETVRSLLQRAAEDGMKMDLGWEDIGAYAVWSLAAAGSAGKASAGSQTAAANGTAQAESAEPGADKATAAEAPSGAGLYACAPDIAALAGRLLVAEAARLLAAAEASAWGITMTDDFPWGSNMTIANQGLILCAAADLTGEARYRAAARWQLDYLLGHNPAGYCYVTGFGTKSPQHPHHRPSVARQSAMPGMLVGGPDSRLEDPCAQQALAGRAPALCYIDDDASYSTNEITIYWNSPLLALIARSA